MGHIRLGRLPKSRLWSSVFAALQGQTVTPAELAQATAVAARHQLVALEGDRGVNYCFWVLVRIATAARSSDFAGELERLGIQSGTATSGLGFVQQVAQAVSRGLPARSQQTIFVRMAELSVRTVLAANIIEQSRSLFGTTLKEIQSACRAISTQKRFGQVAQEFFAHFMSRLVKYLADKELSNHVGPDKAIESPRHVLDFQQALNLYCIESARIVEEFAAGWFSKHNWESNNNITEDEAAGFTAYALRKIQMELRGDQE